MTARARHLLYLGWLGFGNLGDEVMWRVFRRLALRHLGPGWTLTPSRPGVDLEDLGPYDAVVLGGGSVILPGYLRVLVRALELGRRVAVWGAGLDGPGREVTERFLTSPGASSGPPVLDPDLARLLARVLPEASFAGVRGPLTLRALLEAGLPGVWAVAAGDPGLLARAEDAAPPSEGPSGRPAAPGGSERSGRAETTVALNWGTACGRLYGSDEGRVEKALAEVGRRLLGRGYRVRVFWLWGPDRLAAERLGASLERSGRVPVLGREDAWSAITSSALVVSFKLHAAVLAAAAGVPFVALGYRFKVFDFAASLGAASLVIPTDAQDLAERVLAAVEHVIRHRAELAAQTEVRRRVLALRLVEPFRRGLFVA